MQLVIRIDLDNDAFQDALRNLEIARILKNVAKTYENDTAQSYHSLRDCNGNIVGHAAIE